MKDEEQLSLAALYDTWETARLVDAVTRHPTEYAPQALKLMAKVIEKRGASGPEVESFMDSQLLSVPVNGNPELVGTESGTVGRQSVAKPWWFLIPLPATLVTFFVIWLFRMMDRPSGEAEVPMVVMLIGLLLFPSGLFTFILPGFALMHNIVILAFLGYALYLALIVWGCCKPSLKLFFVLCGLLFLNIAGCTC